MDANEWRTSGPRRRRPSVSSEKSSLGRRHTVGSLLVKLRSYRSPPRKGGRLTQRKAVSRRLGQGSAGAHAWSSPLRSERVLNPRGGAGLDPEACCATERGAFQSCPTMEESSLDENELLSSFIWAAGDPCPPATAGTRHQSWDAGSSMELEPVRGASSSNLVDEVRVSPALNVARSLALLCLASSTSRFVMCASLRLQYVSSRTGAYR